METKQFEKDEAFITKIILYSQLLSILVLLLFACNKEEEKSHLSVRLTDTYGNFDAVMIDIQSVEVTGNDGGIVILSTNAGIYNLLEFTNGLNILIATGEFEAVTISQIRLILGPNNTVVVDGVVYPLSTPSAMQSGLKIQVHKIFEPGVPYTILLDFDANQSIVTQGNGDYKLKPVIRIIDAVISGSIKGSLTPLGVIAVITVESENTYFSTVNNAGGEFLIAGLPAGTYDVTVTPALPLLPATIPNVIVTTGASTNVGITGL